MQLYGRAEVGHETMVDALVPAAQMLDEQVTTGTEVVAALAATFSAAHDGALSTRDIVARRGRSFYVSEVSRGVLDPRAVAAALMLQCATVQDRRPAVASALS